MKNFNKIFAIVVTFVAIIAASVNANAQDQSFKITKSQSGDSTLQAYERQRLEDLPWVHAYQLEDKTILKAADCIGWGVEGFLGYHAASGYQTPEAGISIRFDNKKVTYRVSASLLSRKYNNEAIDAGKRYMSYAVDGAFHLNLYAGGHHDNIVSVYATGGYLYGQHRYEVGEAEVEEGTILKSVKHNGSGITYGGGLEYRHIPYASGNSINVRIGYKSLPNTFVNDTKINGTFYVQVGFTFGVKRNRVSNKIHLYD